ncbi:HAMP domain-containing sensor histidine kinase [Mitsuaria sp. 7]|uniref:sensor histidine kinase n=1 Tax=Mitsuaria sp. 7 TaxID=1658665 RepID=UPI0007DCDCC4|nr:HAMP domain-containing sensor histidine kinase [Mitsuaria sp. 7]ANH67415.1 histidine kinase [Mitsuaria sp. 7]
MRWPLNLTQRLALVFAGLLLLCSGASAWLQVQSSRMHEQEVVQGLSRQLAAHIAAQAPLMDERGPMPGAVRRLFGQLMAVNPSVEVYLLDRDGRIVEHAAPQGRLVRERVDLDPVRRFLDRAPLPITGDDPRSSARKVFSAAPLRVGDRDAGFVYVVLLGEAHDRLAGLDATGNALRAALWSIAIVALLCLAAGLIAFGLITRPLRRLAEAVRGYDIDAAAAPALLVDDGSPVTAQRDEIAVLRAAFSQMATRLGEQWRRLSRQDEQRREMVTTISHDLRTPLSSLHGYLETLLLKDGQLDAAQRRRYLEIAIEQSTAVGGLARSLFELARLEQGFVEPQRETFQLTDLVQDVFQKFELIAAQREVTLSAQFDDAVPPVEADLGLIERVLTNLLDNALRHTPAGGEVRVTLDRTVPATAEVTVPMPASTPAQVPAQMPAHVRVRIADTGPGIDPARRADLFQRPFNVDGARRGGGLGLRIVHRILALHGAEIRLLDAPGAAFEFTLPPAPVAGLTPSPAAHRS